jgi:peptidoglycan/xylan/chitin deacetylase (PgdA/CDA1 family)
VFTRRVASRLALPVTAALVLLGCSGSDPGEAQGAGEGTDEQGAAPEEQEATEGDDAAEADDDDAGADDEDEAAPDVDPEEVGADELGSVPILMYHRLLDDGGSEYDLEPDEFREELEWLFDNGYSPVRLKELVRGEFDVPAGRSPVVLTFDDSTREQAQLTEDGDIDPETSMGILIEVAEEYDDVEPLASLYVISRSLFGGTDDGPRIVQALHERGMEIGNHTHNHDNLATLSSSEVQDEFAQLVVEMEEVVPDAEVVTASLPLGVYPEERELAVSGTSERYGTYRNEGVLQVGSDPAPSPFAVDFDPAAIPRIRSSPAWDGGEPDFGSAFWLGQMDGDGAHRRYVSDGDPDTISFPEDRADELDPAHQDRANPY